MTALRNVDPGSGTLSRFDYAYETEGNIVAWSRQLGNEAAKTETYGYDAADQLIAATLRAGDATQRQINYEYDLAGNRTKEEAVVGTLPQTTDYEALEFDAVNRVTAVGTGTRRSEFFYDGLGRRVRMVEREGATVASDRRYLWDGGEIVEERDGVNASVVTKRYFGAGVQEVAANATTNLFYSRDHLGSVREVTDANGNLVARYDYDAWGRRTRVFGTYEADWGYAGYFVHHASKLNLTWYRAYDPDLGRWVSRDPIAEQGGLNLYAYVDNDPINFSDPLGLQKFHGNPDELCKSSRCDNILRDINMLNRSISTRSQELSDRKRRGLPIDNGHTGRLSLERRALQRYQRRLKELGCDKCNNSSQVPIPNPLGDPLMPSPLVPTPEQLRQIANANAALGTTGAIAVIIILLGVVVAL